MTRKSRQPGRARMLRRTMTIALAGLLTVPLAVSGAGASPARRSAVAPRAAALVSALRPAAGPIAGTTCTSSCDLYAVTGTMPQASLPGAPAAGVPVWGYSTTSTAVAAPGGPTIVANQGDAISITLHNVNVPSATSLMIAGQPTVPDPAGVTSGNNRTYSFAAGTLKPGTYLYEAGLTADGPKQVAMGLYGALVVRPTGAPTQAYAAANTAFADEAVLVLSEIDPAFNAAPATTDINSYAPKYWLINGKAYPNTNAITTAAGDRVLLRYVNAGLSHHSMGLLGLHQTIVARDAQLLANPSRVVAETIPSGTTLDTIVSVPAGAPTDARYAIYDAAMRVDNAGVLASPINANPAYTPIAMGGMLTFLSLGGATTVNNGPATSGVNLAPNTTNGLAAVILGATISGAPDRAEYFVDSIGTSGAGCAITGSLTSVSMSIPVTGGTPPCVDLTTLSSGSHTFYVHGHDATSGWGAVASGVLNLDKTGPTIANMALTPSRTNGTADVQLQATASDAATGNQNVTAAEFFIDSQPATTGSGTALAVPTPAPDVSLSATLSAATVSALSEGSHTIAVRAKDASGNWGAFTSITLTVDKTGPGTTGVSATPNPTNGTIGVQVTTGGTFYERIDASITDPLAGAVNSSVTAAEYFIDTVAANGTGGAMIPNDGGFNSPTEKAYGAAELYAIQALSQGTHTIYVHGKDAAGNWGPMASTTLVVDKTPPTFTSVTLSPASITAGTGTVNMTINGAADSGGGGLSGAGQYWFDANAAVAFTGTTNVVIATGTLTAGNHTLSVRISDNAGNISTTQTATLTVTAVPLAKPVVSQLFAGAVRGNNGTLAQRTTTLTITLANPNPTTAITGVGLTDNLPQPAVGNLTVIARSTTCGGTTATANTNRRLVLTGGTIPANGSCTVTATVRLSTNATNGLYTLTNTIPVSGVTSTNAGGNLAPVSAVLTVNA